MKGFVRVAFWSFVFNLTTHYLYSSALIREPEVLSRLPYSALASVGYINGLLFQRKYLVIWALFRTCALLDHFEPPGLPCCVARIALFSDMWKLVKFLLLAYIFRNNFYFLLLTNLFVGVLLLFIVIFISDLYF